MSQRQRWEQHFSKPPKIPEPRRGDLRTRKNKSCPHLDPGSQPSKNCERITLCPSTECRLLHSCGQMTLAHVTTGVIISSIKAPKKQWQLMRPPAGPKVGGQLRDPQVGKLITLCKKEVLHLSPGATLSSPVPLTPGKPPMVPAMRVQGDVTVAVATWGRPLFIYFCLPQNSPCLSFRL